ncbi:MAG TPA: GNAT family N-acetyltransferase [Kofleriaceae bacterium]|nr:GNAT family N-acetyltransferase [Kofleriaceae bacterium]
MSIRAVHNADFDAIAAITNHYITTSTIHFGYEPVTAADLRDARSPRHPFLVDERGGRVVAYAKAGVWRERAAYAWTTEVGIYVESGSRRGGIGGPLYIALLEACRYAGFHSAIGGIALPNDASVALHQRLGFEHVGTVRDAGFKNDAWHAVAFYQKVLA